MRTDRETKLESGICILCVMLVAVCFFGIICGYQFHEEHQARILQDKQLADARQIVTQLHDENTLLHKPEGDLAETLKTERAAHEKQLATERQDSERQIAMLNAHIQMLQKSAVVNELDPLQKFISETKEKQQQQDALIAKLQMRCRELEDRRVCHCGK